MTKFDIRLRRNQFTQSRIERHKNFQHLLGNYDKSSRRKTRGLTVLVILIIILIALLLAIFDRPELPDPSPEEAQKELLTFSSTVFVTESELMNN